MPQFMTKKTFSLIQQELAVVRKNLVMQAEIIRQAIDSGGGTHDNAMYDAALHQQGVLSSRAQQLSAYLTDVAFIEDIKDGGKKDLVRIGKAVKVKNQNTSETREFLILGVADKDCLKDDRIISNQSPLAKQLLGKSAGDVVVVRVPGGETELEILEVSTNCTVKD